MNDILADLAGMQKPTGILCARARIQRDHPDYLEAFDKGVAAREYSCKSVSDWLRTHDVLVGQEAVRNHRAGNCERCRTS